MTKQRRRTRGNGEGSIIMLGAKRKNPFTARVTVGFTPEGKQKYKYIGYYRTKTEAKKALANYYTNPYNLDKLTAQDIFDKWSETAKVSEKVLRTYQAAVKNSGLQSKVFKEIKLMQLEEAARVLKPSMQLTFRNAWKNLYIYAMKHDMVEKNLAELMELDKYTAKEKELISSADIKKILKSDDVIPIILLYTGMRISELVNLESANIDLEKRIMIGGLKTEAGKNRKIPIHKDIVPIIKKLLAEGNEYLVTSKTGKQINYQHYLNDVWHKTEYLKGYTPHYTRHMFVSQAAKLKLDRGVLQKIIGHANKTTTDIYTHADEEQLIDFIDNFKY